MQALCRGCPKRFIAVILSAAKESHYSMKTMRFLRRFAPRNDRNELLDSLSYHEAQNFVRANDYKTSRFKRGFFSAKKVIYEW